MAYSKPPTPKGKVPFPPKGTKPPIPPAKPGAKQPPVNLKDSMARRLQK